MPQQKYGKKCLNSTQCKNSKLSGKSMKDNPKSGDLQCHKMIITFRKCKLQFEEIIAELSMNFMK